METLFRVKKYGFKVIPILVLVLMALTPVRGADTNFTFEPPTYKVGSLNGQDGWHAGLLVTATNPLIGSQSILLDAYGKGIRSIKGQTFTTLRSCLKIAKVAGSTVIVGLLNTEENPYVDVWVNADRNIYLLNEAGDGWNKTGYTYEAGDVLELTISLDFTNSRYQVSVNNSTNTDDSFTSKWMVFTQMNGKNPTTIANAAGSIQLRGESALCDNISLK